MKKLTIALLSAGFLFGLNSCDSLVESIYDLDKAGEIEEVKKKIIERVGDVLVYEITLNSSHELEMSLDKVAFVTNEGAEEGTLIRNDYELLEDSAEPFTKIIDSEFSVRIHKKNEPKKISDIDFAVIEKNFKAAKAQIPAEYVDHCLYEYNIDFEDNKRADSFTINCVEKGEGDRMEGTNVVTDYYGFLFETDKDGNIVMVDNN